MVVMETKMASANIEVTVVPPHNKYKVLEKIAMPVRHANKVQCSDLMVLAVELVQFQLWDKIVAVIHSGMDQHANNVQQVNWELTTMLLMIKAEHHVSLSIMLLHVMLKTV